MTNATETTQAQIDRLLDEAQALWDEAHAIYQTLTVADAMTNTPDYQRNVALNTAAMVNLRAAEALAGTPLR